MTNRKISIVPIPHIICDLDSQKDPWKINWRRIGILSICQRNL